MESAANTLNHCQRISSASQTNDEYWGVLLYQDLLTLLTKSESGCDTRLVSFRCFLWHRQLLPWTRPVQTHHPVLSLAVWRLQHQHLHHVSLWLWQQVRTSNSNRSTWCAVCAFLKLPCCCRFHRCLKEANDSIADVVGYTFFNLLKMHCFEFSHRLQCTQRNWFGM